MCVCVCLLGHVWFWPGKCYKTMYFLSLPDEVSELAWAALRLRHHCVQAACSQTPMPFAEWAGGPMLFCLLHWTNIWCVAHIQCMENFWDLGFGICRMNCCLPAMPSNAHEWSHVPTGKDIYCSNIHMHKDNFVFNTNIYWTQQNNMIGKVMAKSGENHSMKGLI